MTKSETSLHKAIHLLGQTMSRQGSRRFRGLQPRAGWGRLGRGRGAESGGEGGGRRVGGGGGRPGLSGALMRDRLVGETERAGLCARLADELMGTGWDGRDRRGWDASRAEGEGPEWGEETRLDEAALASILRTDAVLPRCRASCSPVSVSLPSSPLRSLPSPAPACPPPRPHPHLRHIPSPPSLLPPLSSHPAARCLLSLLRASHSTSVLFYPRRVCPRLDSLPYPPFSSPPRPRPPQPVCG